MLPSAQPLLAAHFVGVVLATMCVLPLLPTRFLHQSRPFQILRHHPRAYYRAYTTDPRHMKLIVRTRLFRDRFLVLISAALRKVALLLLLDTSQVFLTLASIYDYTIRLRGDETALQYVFKPFIASMAITVSLPLHVHPLTARVTSTRPKRDASHVTAIHQSSATARPPQLNRLLTLDGWVDFNLYQEA
ncbi:hypothetical protein C8R46DRAFT_1218692 [Mycena filopes]|nr:hypothetical protein C8R46DRAFT_1218692 [Mycena filopes]